MSTGDGSFFCIPSLSSWIVGGSRRFANNRMGNFLWDNLASCSTRNAIHFFRHQDVDERGLVTFAGILGIAFFGGFLFLLTRILSFGILGFIIAVLFGVLITWTVIAEPERLLKLYLKEMEAEKHPFLLEFVIFLEIFHSFPSAIRETRDGDWGHLKMITKREGMILGIRTLFKFNPSKNGIESVENWLKSRIISEVEKYKPDFDPEMEINEYRRTIEQLCDKGELELASTVSRLRLADQVC